MLLTHVSNQIKRMAELFIRKRERTAGRSLSDRQSLVRIGRKALKEVHFGSTTMSMPFGDAIPDCDTALELEQPGESG